MKLTTRLVRNISFATMVAVMPLVQQVPVFAEGCGPYWCESFCAFQGGHIYWRNCDAGSCTATPPCGGFGENCYDYCIYCDGEWTCLKPDPE